MSETQILYRNLRKVSIQGAFAPKTPNFEVGKQVPHSEQATSQGMHCREILFTPPCSPRAKEFPRSSQLFCATYGCEATRRQSCPIFGFWPIFPIQNAWQSTFRWRAGSLEIFLNSLVKSLQPRGYIAEWLWFFHVVVEGPKGCLPAADFFCNFWLGSCGPPNLPKFSPTALIQNATAWRVRSGPKMSENA